MSNKRMNHVFNEMVVKAGRDIDTAELQFINGGVSATFFCTQQAIHAAHAINNHDRMVEEIAELKEFVEMVANGINEDPQGAVVHLRVHSREAKNLLAKLNKDK